MKLMILVPPILAAVAGSGAAICHALGRAVHARELLVAAGIAIAAAEAALVPALLTRGHSTAAVAQAGLAGTVLQMLLSFALLGLVAISGIGMQPAPLVWWSLAFYWVSLGLVVAGVIGEIRAAQDAAAMHAGDGSNAKH